MTGELRIKDKSFLKSIESNISFRSFFAETENKCEWMIQIKSYTHSNE